MNTHHTDTSSTPTTSLDTVARLYPISQAELDALDIVRQQYQDGLLTLAEALRTMEGTQRWQHCSRP